MSLTRLIITEKGKALQRELFQDLLQDDIPNYQPTKSSRIITEDIMSKKDEYIPKELPPDRTGYFRPKGVNSLSVSKNKLKAIYPLYIRKEDDYPPRHLCEFREKSTTDTEKMKLQKPIFRITHHTNFHGNLYSSNDFFNIVDSNGGLDAINTATNDSFYLNPDSTQRTKLRTDGNHLMPITRTSPTEGRLDSNSTPFNMKKTDSFTYNTLPKLTGFGSTTNNFHEKICTKPNSPLGSNQFSHFDHTSMSFKSLKPTTRSLNTTLSASSLSLNRMFHQYDPVKISRILEKAEKTKKRFFDTLEDIEKKSSTINSKTDNVYKDHEFLSQFKQKYDIIQKHEDNQKIERNHYNKKLKELQRKKYEILWSKLHFPSKPLGANKFSRNNFSKDLHRNHNLAGSLPQNMASIQDIDNTPTSKNDS